MGRPCINSPARARESRLPDNRKGQDSEPATPASFERRGLGVLAHSGGVSSGPVEVGGVLEVPEARGGSWNVGVPPGGEVCTGPNGKGRGPTGVIVVGRGMGAACGVSRPGVAEVDL